MKKFLAVMIVLTASSVFAQDYSPSEGRRIIRIEVGNERNNNDSREMGQRIMRLERAVRELQNKVYDLEETTPRSREVTVITCSLPTSFDGIFIGKASTETEARANAVNNCKRSGAAFCDDRYIRRCETSRETVNY